MRSLARITRRLTIETAAEWDLSTVADRKYENLFSAIDAKKSSCLIKYHDGSLSHADEFAKFLPSATNPLYYDLSGVKILPQKSQHLHLPVAKWFKKT